MVAYPDLYIIRYFNNKLSWGNKVFQRIFSQLLFAVVLAVIISLLITLLANWIKPYSEDLIGVLISNALIYSVVNIVVMSILEGWIQYIESRQAKQIADTLQTELSQIKFEVLKSQINPHFMFNSLNVLSSLIGQDDSKAHQFIDEFSHIYRCVLETIEQPVATLDKELDFARSYLFLQQIRYGNDLNYTMDIPAEFLNYVLPPLSLQVVLENATKHNIVNKAKPLLIEISSEGSFLIVKNTIQPKISKGTSTGLGLKNLVKRYSLISKSEPVFTVDANSISPNYPCLNPKMMNILIIEDESLAADKLEKMLKEVNPSFKVLAKLGSIKESVNWLMEHTADLIFLDIQLSDGISFSIFDQVNVNTPIIFTTAYDEYAVKAFQLNSVSYLLKPIRQRDLVESLNKYKALKSAFAIDFDSIISKMQGREPQYKKRFMIQIGEKIRKIRKIDVSEVAYFYVMEKSIYLKNFDGKSYPIEFSLDKLELLLNPSTFFRINRKYIVNMDAISNMIAYSRSRVKLELLPEADDQSDTIVSIDRSADFKMWLNK